MLNSRRHFVALTAFSRLSTRHYAEASRPSAASDYLPPAPVDGFNLDFPPSRFDPLRQNTFSSFFYLHVGAHL